MKKLTTFILLFLSAALFCMGQQKVNVMVDIENIARGGSLPKPTYNGTEKGIVVVQVIVDKQGNVTGATPGAAGSTTQDSALLTAAEASARRARFTMKKDVDGLSTGNIIYGFGVELSPDNIPGKGVQGDNISIKDLFGEQYDEVRKELGISEEDVSCLSRLHGYDVQSGNVLNQEVLQQFDGYMPLTAHAAKELKARGVVSAIRPVTDKDFFSGTVYPLNAYTGWTRDNYGPVWIPKKGASIDLTLENLPVYERCIKVYEGNDLQVKGNTILINGKPATKYTFKLDYYWMQGDNRHNSADSRYWGFVPEDHIVGKPLFIWWSSDPDRGGLRGIRWNRLFRWVDGIK
jgi:hypothetical protein